MLHLQGRPGPRRGAPGEAMPSYPVPRLRTTTDNERNSVGDTCLLPLASPGLVSTDIISAMLGIVKSVPSAARQFRNGQPEETSTSCLPTRFELATSTVPLGQIQEFLSVSGQHTTWNIYFQIVNMQQHSVMPSLHSPPFPAFGDAVSGFACWFCACGRVCQIVR